MDFNALQTALLDDLSATSSDAFYTTALIKRVLNRAHKWAASMRNWPQTEETYKRDSSSSTNYYNYPTNFKTDSITELVYNGKIYDKTVWKEYRKYLRDNPTGTDKIWSDLKRQYHINENVALATITNGIEITGHIIPDDMVNNSDTTLFVGDANVENAIIKYALSILYKKGRGQMFDRGVALEDEAKGLLGDAWTQIMLSQGDYKSGEGVVFNQIDILPSNRGSRRTAPGNFRTVNR